MIQIWFGKWNWWLLKLKNSCCVQGIFNLLWLYINCVSHIKSEPRFIFVFQKSLKWTFKTGFWVQNNLWEKNNTRRQIQKGLFIHKCYFVVKKLVWNVCIKAFWYTKYLWSFFNVIRPHIFWYTLWIWLVYYNSLSDNNWWHFFIQTKFCVWGREGTK